MMNKKQELMIIDEESIRDKIYTIREEKVMLDYELAKIYGYSTRRFNEQVKNNEEKFRGFVFRLTRQEVEEISRSKKSTAIMQTAGVKGGRTSLPYAFTESGIYMLMTVLKGPLAIEQSRKLITIFKSMKDYLINSNNLATTSGIIELTNQVHKNTSDISDIKNQLTVVMDNFINPSSYKEYLIMNGEKFEADVIYCSIYRKAKKSIKIVDDYINIKTFELLKEVEKGITIDIYSDNVNKLSETIINDFVEQTNLDIKMHKTHSLYHDRFIIIDDSLLYLSGPSSKDAGNKIGMIIEVKNKNILEMLIKNLRGI
ncbi:MAG: ORF6N domain-containing protein [Erysipelotrichaceae bacterium]|nr:ORF6N domain-containing protein [Erysipelotrichaceae bacterium]